MARFALPPVCGTVVTPKVVEFERLKHHIAMVHVPVQ